MSFHGCDLRKGRVSIPGQIYLVTTASYKRAQLFRTFHNARIVARSIHFLAKNRQLESFAYVVMPDHLHWLFALDESSTLAEIISQLKRATAYYINQRQQAQGRAVWQRGYHDRALRSEDSVREVARYIVGNPLRAGLVDRVGDYPFWDAVWL